jgi:transposase-like protein
METTNMKMPETLQEAIKFFADPDQAFAYAVMMRWPDGKVTCPRCGSDRHSFIKTRRIWYCNPCKKQFTLKVGTIFEDSPISMDKWMTAVWQLVSCKNGISSYELASAIGVTQKTAWFMLHRIRKALQTGTFVKMLGGDGKEVEVDETFIGGKARNMHPEKRRTKIQGRRGGLSGKVAVMGLLERHGEVRLQIVPNVRRHNLVPHIKENVAPDTEVFTDALKSYQLLGMDEERYAHFVIDHAESYAKGRVHTNGLENFWSLLKRGLKGTYVSVEPFHLYRYLDEQAFRFNNRKDLSNAERFALAMSQVSGKRLTYAELTGKEDGQLHQ